MASKRLQFCTCTVHFRSIYFSCMLWGQQCASVPKISKWKCSPMEAHIQRHVPRGTVSSEGQTAPNVKLHHSRNKKPVRDSPEWQGNNEVFKEHKDLYSRVKGFINISLHHRECWEILAPDVFFQAQIVDSEMLKHEVLNKLKSHKLLGMKGIYPRRTGGI